MSDADAYMILARFAISMAAFPHGLRQWWKDEEMHRAQYGLSDEQIAELVGLCRERVETLAREAEPYAVV